MPLECEHVVETEFVARHLFLFPLVEAQVIKKTFTFKRDFAVG